MDKKEIIEKVLRPLEKAGFKAYFVGGCVRDAIMGIKPHDYDVCTDATPEEIKKVFGHISEMSENAEPFGVTMPVIDGELIEIATMREDITKGRHPQIKFTKALEKDAERRDFTMNALYEDADGNIIDPTGGKADIENKVLRFVGSMEARCNEDPLRIFRAVRFQAKTGFTPAFGEIELSRVAGQLIESGRFEEVSKERQLKELEGIFGGKHFDKAFVGEGSLFFPSLVPDIIGMRPIIDSLMATNQSFKWHAEGSAIKTEKFPTGTFVEKPEDLEGFKELITLGDAWTHTRKVMENMFDELNKTEFETHKRFLMMLAAFLHDIGKPIAAEKLGIKHSEFEVNGVKIVEDVPKVTSHDVDGEIPAHDFCKSLGLTNKECHFIAELVKHHMRAHQIGDMKNKARLWKFVQKFYFKELVMLARADERGCIKTQSDEWSGIDGALERPDIKVLVETPLPKPLIDGKVLIAHGFEPAPSFKKMIDVAFENQINKSINDVEFLVKLVKGIYTR